MSAKYQTQDLYEASFILSKGIELRDLCFSLHQGKRTAFFIFDDDDAKSLSDSFKIGQATANICIFKISMNRLKDLLFERLRNSETKESVCSGLTRSKR
jgi:hypothetical protein